MTIRPYAPADRAAVLALHERHDRSPSGKGEGFWFANPDDPLNEITLLAEEDGQLVAAVTGRACLEALLMIDPGWSGPRERFELIQRLIDEGGALAAARGYREVHIATPILRFAYRLSRLAHVYVERRWKLILDLYGKHTAAERQEVA